MFGFNFSRPVISRVARRAALTLTALAVVSGAASAAVTTIYGTVNAGARNVHTMWIGEYDNFVKVRGDGDTDLDCWLYDGNGRLVSSDTDGTDFCILPAPGIGTHRLAIRNQGIVYNRYVVWTEN